jgi:hypothetical protein
MRPHQRFCSEPCWKLENEREPASGSGQRVEQDAVHPLRLVRDQAALDKHTRDLNGLIRQAIIDAIKTTGDCHADDLHDLYPVGEVDHCRELATRQFASLRSGKNPVIYERERRKSSITARKGGKSGVYVFTRYGREQLVGLSSGASGGTGVATAQSGENENVGVGVDHHGDGEGALSIGVDAPAVGVDLGDSNVGAGQASDKRDQGRAHSSSSAGTDAPDLLQLDVPRESGSSAYDAWEDEAA